MQKKIELDWKDPVTTPPQPFVSVLVYMPGESPLPTVHEGFVSDTGVWCVGGYRLRPGEVVEWADMPTR